MDTDLEAAELRDMRSRERYERHKYTLEVCGLCGQLEPVDRNREFVYRCPRRSDDQAA